MQLTLGQVIDRTGTISGRQVLQLAGGQSLAKATLALEGDADRLPVVWWEPGRAPPDGARVRIKGRVKAFNGKAEIHAHETVVERAGAANGPLAAIAAFYLGCIEAEAAGSLRLKPGDNRHIVLRDAASPLHEARRFSEGSAHRAWLQARRKAVGETLLAGWPLVVGADPDTGKGALVATPLLISEVELGSSDGEWWIQRLGAGADLNAFALELLIPDRAARQELMAAVEASVEVEEAATSAARSDAILRVLREEGIAGLEALDPAALSAPEAGKGIHNSGVVMATTGSARAIRNLVQDLEELANYPELLSKGPAAVLLGQTPAPEVPLPAAHPAIALSTLHQDQTVHAAMVNDFTVVTGPPGTGKSQVLVNVVAAAVAKGETVLLASKNNRAVDVVVDRLRSASPNAVVIRAGHAGQRNEVAGYIADILSKQPRNADSAGARQAWATVEKSLQGIYGSLNERRRIDAELADLEAKLQAALNRLPSGAKAGVAISGLDAALADARKALDAFGDPLWLFGRWRRHRRRLENARHALGRVGTALKTSHLELEQCLSSVADRPKRTLAPRKAFRAIEQTASEVRIIAEHRRQIEELRARLAALVSEHELDDRLNALRKDRLDAGTKRLDARWAELQHENPSARAAAARLAEAIERMPSWPQRALTEVFLAIPEALPALPVWAVTNLSARTNLPLQAGLFDLVVIDEASQCDAASALPLLVRGKRALIIGDQKQLIHITSLSRAREQVIARKRGLTDRQAAEFSYRDRSCFGLASSRVLGTPIFLDLHFRSHPGIVGFSNEQFYGGRLELCSEAAPPEGLRAIQWIRVSGNSARGTGGRSRVNAQEARRVVQAIVRGLPTYKGLACSVGVVTPYGAQVERISALLSKAVHAEDLKSLKVATAHRFQGDERDVMYFSPVIDRSMSAREVRFAANPNLINVALTRARRRLIIVGDPDACLAHDNALRELANYSLRLDAAGFDSPLELDLHNALLNRGVAARTGVVVGRHRLDLAVERDDMRLDIECDGAAFHTDRQKDAARDRAVEAEGWKVMRFSGRALSHDIEACVAAIIARLALETATGLQSASASPPQADGWTA